MANATKDHRAGNRDMVIRTRFTPDENREVERAAKRERMSRAAFMREAALNAARRHSEQPPRHAAAPSTPALDRETSHQLRMIGNNLNQIARAMNAGRVDFGLPDARLLFEHVNATLDAIAEATGGRRA